MMELADADELMDNPIHPYTQSLLSAVPIPDPETARPVSYTHLGLQLRKQHDITSGAVTVTFTDGIYYKTYKDFNA